MSAAVKLPEALLIEPMLVSTAQGTALYAISNVLAQVIENRRNNTDIRFSWPELTRFTVVMSLICPPTFYWQVWMERNWPGQRQTGKREYLAVPSDFELDGIHRDSLEANADRPSVSQKGPDPPQRYWRNVWTKWVIDNSLGALWYTLLFIVLVEVFKWHSLRQIWEALIRDTFPLLIPSYIVWPAATLFNFIWIPAEKRVVFLAFVGLVWGVYLSIFSSDSQALPAEQIRDRGQH